MFKSILAGLAREHPQALYYSLRAFVLEKREAPPSSEASAGAAAAAAVIPRSYWNCTVAVTRCTSRTGSVSYTPTPNVFSLCFTLMSITGYTACDPWRCTEGTAVTDG